MINCFPVISMFIGGLSGIHQAFPGEWLVNMAFFQHITRFQWLQWLGRPRAPGWWHCRQGAGPARSEPSMGTWWWKWWGNHWEMMEIDPEILGKEHHFHDFPMISPAFAHQGNGGKTSEKNFIWRNHPGNLLKNVRPPRMGISCGEMPAFWNLRRIG